MNDALKYLLKLLRYQTIKCYIAIILTIICVVIALYIPFSYLNSIKNSINNSFSWAPIIFMITLPWFSVYLFWTLNTLWSSRAGQLEDLIIMLQLKHDETISQDDFIKIMNLLRRDFLLEKAKLPLPNFNNLNTKLSNKKGEDDSN